MPIRYMGVFTFVGGQYESMHHLLGELAAYTARAPYLSLRPRSRPRSAESARAWWGYAIAIVRQQLEASISWKSVQKVNETEVPGLLTLRTDVAHPTCCGRIRRGIGYVDCI